ncbi:MAG: 50S ribosomal protein L9 [Candidatus Moranbacteria bacterium]|nr:50S ribosomal protein L9 [Candidatus Moranbacteria bacterium]
MEEAEKIKERRIKLEQKAKQEAEKLAEKIKKLKLEISKKQKDEKLFGSVSTSDIQEALKGAGFELEKKQIIIETPIKIIGEHQVFLQLTPDIKAELKIKVKAQK